MKSMSLRWLINCAALWVTGLVVPGIHGPEKISQLIIIAVLLVIVNLLMKPLLMLIITPLILFTFGSIILLVNAILLWLTAWIAGLLSLGFSVDGLLPAIAGGVVITIFHALLAWALQRYKIIKTTKNENEWVKELETAIDWLIEQRDTWKRNADERELIIQEQLKGIERLNVIKSSLEKEF